MRTLLIIAIAISSMWLVSCGGGQGNNPGQAYMPDMYYSRAYEAFGYNNVDGEHDSLKARGILYTGMPVPGTIARGDMVHHLSGDSAGLAASNSLRNPLDTIRANAANMMEAERLYLVYCGICHGSKLDGNGPLWNGGNGPYPAKPQDLIGYAKNLSDGHMFHVITYGIRTMGSYASQLRPEQRWWVIKYIRAKQGAGGADTTATAATAAAGATGGVQNAATTDTSATNQ